MKNVLLFILLFASLQLTAQEHYVFSPISSINGLSDNRVRALCQLPDGRMIIVTEGLVNIYDGATFRYIHYNEQRAYPLSEYSGYHHAYVDKENHLWLKNQYKLMLFDIRTESFSPNIDSVFSSQKIQGHVVDIFMDTEHNLWYVTTNDELIFKDSKSNKAECFLPHISSINGSKDHLYDIAIYNNLLFLFYKSGVMVCYNFNTRKELYHENPFGKKNAYTNTLMVVPYKQYLYQARNGYNSGLLLRFNIINRKWEKVFEANYWLNTLTINNNGDCWISSLKGLWLIDQNTLVKRQISPLQLVDGRLFESEISTQYNDDKGGLWVGTVNRGMLYYHPERFKFRNFGRSLFKASNNKSFNVNSFAENDGEILVGTTNGLFRYTKNTSALEPSKLIPANTQCEMLMKDSKQRIWLCTSNNGLFCINKNKVKHYTNPGGCQYIYEASDSSLYVCSNLGMGKIDPQTGEFKRAALPPGRNLSLTFQLIGYTQDSLLGYGNEGLFIYNRYTNTIVFPSKNSRLLRYPNHHYHCLLNDSRSLIWIGTMDGLNVFNPATNETVSFFEEDGLINNSIRSVTEDNSGKIWVSTSNGISCIHVSANGNAYTYSFINYNQFDGIIENDFMPRAVFRTSDNRLLWGGLDGFNETNLNRINSPRLQLSVPLFIRFLVSGTEIKRGADYGGNIILKQSISATNEIKLKYFQNFFGVEFSALNYVNPTQTYYRYKLEGADDKWREMKTTDGVGRVYYTRLAPGTYHLSVYAANNYRQWGSQFAGLTIVIHPPFWKTIWAYTLYLLILMGSLYVGISYFIRRNKLRMENQQKEALDQMKFSFFTNISHELRTPLTLIMTPLDSILKKTPDGQLKNQLSGIYRNAAELLKLVNQLLDFRKLEIKGEKLHLSFCNISEFFETIVYSFNELRPDKEIDFIYECSSANIFAYIDSDKLHKIVNNLINNAYKFTPKKGKIVLRLQKELPESIRIQIIDTGCGIPEVDLPHIFDRFYQAKNQIGLNTGSGIGLHLLKEYVILHGGTVEVESRVNEGSTFTVSIPADLLPESQTAPGTDVKEEKQTLKLLVVEDNSEFRTFLQNELLDKYHVHTATNGKLGLEKARALHPDLVISDVMMPEMSGTELCQNLKNDVQTSHIPVILLTAKASDQAQIEGFEAGADAYITKPFNMEILLLRISNLIEQQQQRKNAFKKAIFINPESFTSSNVDEELIKKALGFIEKNLDNDCYSVEQLSKEMFMDRTGLYRKLVAIIGQTPSEFIRSVRLKKAAQLLEIGLSVTEVAEKVGFAGTISYFAKCFHDEFGIKPSHYKNRNKNQATK
jgi:signal transduction histidine kinase/DNA-binding response OmpR family regulator/ligand-binding sensor domain-containing protein